MEHLPMTYSEMQLVNAAIDAALSANTAALRDSSLKQQQGLLSIIELRTHMERHERNQGKLFAVGSRLNIIMEEAINKWESGEE